MTPVSPALTRTGKAAAVAAVVLVALAAGTTLALRRRGPEHHLVVAAVRQPATSLLFVAQAAGCFADERLALEERTFELGRDALVPLQDGTADVAIAYATPVLRTHARDPRLRVLTTLHTSTRNTRLVARRDRGVASFADLRGKRLGLAHGTNADFFADLVLALGGVPRSEVTRVDVQPPDAVAALAAGSVDAAVLFDPYAGYALAAAGPGAIEIVSEVYTEVSLLATRSDLVAGRRAALLALLRGLACGERALRERPDVAFAAARARFPELTGAELGAQLERVTRGLGLDEVVRAVLSLEAEWMRGEGGAPELSTLLDPTLLDEVEPEAMNLLVDH